MFNKLKSQVQERFKELTKLGQSLFYIDIDRDLIWEKYLSGFADTTERQEHNCNCCKSFLRQYAGIVTIDNNIIRTIWDITPDQEFAQSIKNVRDYIVSLPITTPFANQFAKLGTDKNVDGKNKQVIWNHFFIELPRQYVHKQSESLEAWQGTMRDSKNVFKRSLDELTTNSVDTVLELIDQNSLYRGAEFKGLLIEFRKLRYDYLNVPTQLRDNYCWDKVTTVNVSLTRIRNTAIGTLLINLSENMDLDVAVTKFEAVVAPTNYKRPTALVTPRMVEDAKNKIMELGYLESLARRFAVAADLNVNDLLFVDKSSTLTDVFEDMKKDTTVNPRTLSKTEEISIDAFISDVLPKAKALYVLLENSHLRNMATLLTGMNTSPSLFKWNNPFSWAYSGGITDSIKERVKAAGGKVDGELRVSLSWHNHDDLDLHVVEPNGNRIYYREKHSSYSDGILDVDMNAGSGTTRTPVENIVFTNSNRMLEGLYTVHVNNFCQRETTNPGFEVQIECRGEVYDLQYSKNPRNTLIDRIVEFNYTRKDGLVMRGNVQSNISDKDKWNLKTNRFHKVKQILLSPNCWSGIDRGNKHHFFILENCASDEPTRPFFNEFLKEELVVHRKFFEVFGGKLLISPTNTQLAGLGFSATQRNHVIVRVEGAFKRTLKINF